MLMSRSPQLGQWDLAPDRPIISWDRTPAPLAPLMTNLGPTFLQRSLVPFSGERGLRNQGLGSRRAHCSPGQLGLQINFTQRRPSGCWQDRSLGPGVGMGHASLFLSTLATPAPAVPRRDSQMVQMVPQRQEEVPLTQAGSFSAHALSTSPGLRQAAWE